MFYIDINRIIKNYNIDIIYNNKIKLGKIENSKNNNIIININPNLDIKKERFILSHLFSHYILNHLKYKNKFIEKKENFQDNVTNLLEYEANIKAIEILLPQNKIDFLIFNKNITSIKEISNIMLISEVAIEFKLKILNYINN